MDQLVPFGSTVNGGGLVERGVNAGQCRHVHNGTVAGALPDVRKNIDRLEVLGFGHKVDRRTAKGGDQLVDQAAGRRKQGAQNTDNDHGGDEVGQVHHGLYAALEEFTADFVDEQSQNDGNGKAHNNGIQADAKCVFDQTAKILGFKELDEIFEANPNINGAVIFNSTCYILGNYLKARGMQSVKLVGYDLIGRNTQLLSEGVITALIAQRPERQGYDGIKSLCNHLLFKQGSEKVNLMPIDILLKENLKYYLNNKL